MGDGVRVIDFIVNRGWLDRWRGTNGLLGRIVRRSDVRWLHRMAEIVKQ